MSQKENIIFINPVIVMKDHLQDKFLVTKIKNSMNYIFAVAE